MRIAHLAFDQKFIPFAQDIFEEAFPRNNTWIVLHEEHQPIKFVRESRHVRLVDWQTLRSRDCLRAINGSHLLVVHAMTPEFASVVKNLSADVTVLWIGWGYEYYSFLEKTFGDLILPETAAVWRRALADERPAHKGFLHLLKSVLRPAYGALRRALVDQGPRETIQTVASRIDLCSVSPSEMPLLKASFPDFRAAHYQLHYYSKEDTLERGPAHMAGPDILLGNSAMPENNHIEAMYLLRRMRTEGRKIVAPLSYGPSHYADEVCRIGAALFGSDFVPMRDYLPIDEYHEELTTCGTVIMNHRRQAAMGNISAALYKGAKVILREENPIYQTYMALGAVVCSVQSIEQSPEGSLRPLSADEREWNRRVVGEYMSRDSLIKAIRELRAYTRHAAAGNGLGELRRESNG